jgi:hypothetical protein
MKRTVVKRRPLADSVLVSLEPGANVYREHDGAGLYFRVKPNEAKSSELRFKTLTGQWSWLGIGGFPEVSDALAREKAETNRKKLSAGVNPLEQRRAVKVAVDKSKNFRASSNRVRFDLFKFYHGEYPSVQIQPVSGLR